MTESPSNRVVLPPVVDLDALDGVRDGLIEAIETGPVTVIGNKVERLSTNALLMLISAAETARRNKNDFAIADASAPMLAAIERLGLDSSFAGMMRG